MEDLNQVMEPSENKIVSLYFFIKLPKELVNVIQSYDDIGVWEIAELVKYIKQLPNDILEIIKLYARIASFGNHWTVICDLNDYYREIESWLDHNDLAYRICPHCADHIEVSSVMNLICPCERIYPTKRWTKSKYGLYPTKDKDKEKEFDKMNV